MKKKMISLLLVLALVTGIAVPVGAVEAETSEPQDYTVESIEDGNIFFQQTDEKTVAIITDDTTHAVSISIKYSNAESPNTTYQWIFNDYPVETFSPNDLTFWQDIIRYAENQLDDATIVTFMCEERDYPQTRSSAGADLKADMIDELGNEYTGKYYYGKNMGYDVYQLYEDFSYNIRKVKTLTWLDAISAATWLVNVANLLKLLDPTRTMATVLLIFDVVGPIASALIPAGKANEYKCLAQYTRYIKINGGSRKYCSGYKWVEYKGYEDASDNSTGRAHIIQETKDTYYGPSEEYFNTGIFDDAYGIYNNVGMR